MSDESLRSQAQSRDLTALRTLLEPVLPSSMHLLELHYQRHALHLCLAATPTPNPEIVAQLVPLIAELHIDQLQFVEIYGQPVGHALPHWREKIDLSVPVVTRSTPRPTPSEPPVAIASLESLQNPGADSIPPPSQATRHSTPPTRAAQPLAQTLIRRYAAGERNFQQIDASHTDCSHATFALANLQDTKWVWANLSHTRFGKSNLTGANFRHADLTHANLQSAQLQGADFRGANLQGANLSWAELRGANFTDANLTDANLHQAQLAQVTMPDGTYLD